MKIAVVTSNIGNRTNTDFTDDCIYFPNIDYHAFLDYEIKNNFWKTHNVVKFTDDLIFQNRRNAKIYKILPFFFLQGYDYYIWMDSSHRLICNPENFLSECEEELFVFKHSARNCIYEESELINLCNLDLFDNVSRQIEYYKNLEYPTNNGLYELPCFIIKNTEKMKQMSLMWWEQICKFSSRDQISLPYVIDKLKIKPKILEGNSQTSNEFFKRVIDWTSPI